MTSLSDYTSVLHGQVPPPAPLGHSDRGSDSDDESEAPGPHGDQPPFEQPPFEQPPEGSSLSLGDSDSFSLFLAEVESYDRTKDDEDKLQQLRSGCDEYEEQLLGGIVATKKNSATFSDIHISGPVMESLQRLTTLALLRPDAFTYGVLRNNRVAGALLYGPSGTGKTLLGRALAKQAGVTMLEVSGADVLQRCVGEGEKIARAIFTLARKLHPCIVFIDEADSFLASRKSSDRSWERSMINQFLREWDSMTAGSGDAAFILLATNRPFDLDIAVLRRVPARFLIDIPTPDDRKAILEILLKDEKLSPKADIPTLVGLTSSYTGSDLKNLCVTAALECVSEDIRRATTGTPKRRILRRRHFDTAMTVIKPTVTDPITLNRLRMFDRRSNPLSGVMGHGAASQGGARG